MARAISMRNTVVPLGERVAFREKATRAKAHYSRAGCQYWLFEEGSLPGAYLEFFEAASPEKLRRAHSDAPDPVVESARMYVEVMLT